MKWLVVLCLLASNASATPPTARWGIQTFQGQVVALDVTRTATGYTAALHETQNLWEVQWRAIPCPQGTTGEQPAGERLLEAERQSDGTFTVKIYKTILYTSGPNGLGEDPVTRCWFDSPLVYVGRIVNRATAAALDPSQVDRYPRDHDTFMTLQQQPHLCPVPDSAKRICMGGRFPLKPIIDMEMIDSDGDGIFDEWELGGLRDGTNFLDLKSMGANPDHKDLFVQMDTTVETGYPDQVLKDVRDYFGTLPIANPDGRNGVSLHIDAGPETRMTGNQLWGRLSKADQNVPVNDVFTTGGCNATDRTPLTNLQLSFDPLRAKVFRYIVVAKYLVESADGSHPCGGMNWNIPSKAFVIGTWARSSPAPDWVQKGLLLHELGHSLGLFHAGGTGQPFYKPNYQSVMNYGYQELGVPLRGAPTSPGRYVYSNVDPSRTNGIDEEQLADNDGLPAAGLSGTVFVYTCPSTTSGVEDAPLHTIAPGVAADFRCDGDAHSAGPNDITFSDGNNPTKLETYNDVAHLHLPLEDGPSTFGAGRSYAPEGRSVEKALQDYGVRIHDQQSPTVKLSLKKKGQKRQLSIKAHDDKGLSSAVVKVGTKSFAVSLSAGGKLAKDVTKTVDVDATGDVSVLVSDVATKTGTATAK